MTSEEIKSKRPPNRWQLFLKDCSPRQNKSLGMTEKVSACSIEYRTLKEIDPKKLDGIIERVKNNKEGKINGTNTGRP